MNTNSDTFYTYAVVAIIILIVAIIIIGKAISNYWFKVRYRNRLLESQVYFLAMIAEKSGVAREDINEGLKNVFFDLNDKTELLKKEKEKFDIKQ